MSLYNSDYFIRLSENKSYIIKDKLLSESRKYHTAFDIFLSHSINDKKVVEGIYIELTNMGYSVYVDWIIDPDLDRNNVTKETAELVRKRMRSSKKLLLAMSTNATLSKWIPWELGFIDGNVNNCALFPVAPGTETKDNFERREYLLLYPYFKKARMGVRDELLLIESDNSFVTIDNWIRKDLKPSYQTNNIKNL